MSDPTHVADPVQEIDWSAIAQRHGRGEKITDLARDLGMSWQKVHAKLYPSPAKTVQVAVASTTVAMPPQQFFDAGEHSKPSSGVFGQTIFEPATGSQKPLFDSVTGTQRSDHRPLILRYRPRRLCQVVGQAKAVRALQTFARNPCTAAFVFEGDTGTGKTSSAWALAGELGCDLEHPEYGGVSEIPSGEQTADSVREVTARLWSVPMCGSGWRVLIVNEADRMSGAAETIWLDALENLPGRTVVVFTTNHWDKLSQRFRDRCERVRFEADAEPLRQDARQLVGMIWRQETGRSDDHPAVEEIVEAAIEDGKLSFRRAVQLVARLVRSEAASGPTAESERAS